MGMKIEVLPEDIFYGCPHIPDRCPVARAVRRALDATDVAAGFTRVRVGITQYKTSRRMRVWMNKFDNGEEVQPFKFLLRERKSDE
jgi:hypothetical protein